MSLRELNVVGGAGFIGTRLCRRLVASGKPPFTIIDKKVSGAFPERSVICDIRDAQRLKSVLVPNAAVVHLAAEHRDNVRPAALYRDVNVTGTKNVCRAATEVGINTILFTSTVAVYGLPQAGTGEAGAIAPFNEYGRTKWEAEEVLRGWAAQAPDKRRLVLVRPTVVFGENNRGNVYNLLRQISSGRFVMVGSGRNRKSLAYVENVAAFLENRLHGPPGVEIWNYVDGPDLTMNQLVAMVRSLMGRPAGVGARIPYAAGVAIGEAADLLAWLTGRSFAVSKVRVKKFCAETSFTTASSKIGFVPPVPLAEAMRRTVQHEFLETHNDQELFTSE